MKRSLTRRQMLAGSGAFALSAALSGTVSGVVSDANAASPLPSQPSLLIAGPAGGLLDRWAELIAPSLGHSMGGGGTLARSHVGGADGVTGVNRYQARTSPDGATALLLPGSALLAWLVGDNRVRFDAGTWAPLWGGSIGASVATRAPLVVGQTVRIVLGSVAGPELEALLALHMMGVDVVPMRNTREDPLRRADVDAVYLRGRPERQQLAALGWHPAFALPAQGTGQPVRDPALADLPIATALFAASRAESALLPAFRAVSAAASLELALVMPSVVPAAVLAWWRRGCEQLDDDTALREAAASTGLRQDGAGMIAAQLADISLATADMLALRTLLVEHFHWRPS